MPSWEDPFSRGNCHWVHVGHPLPQSGRLELMVPSFSGYSCKSQITQLLKSIENHKSLSHLHLRVYGDSSQYSLATSIAQAFQANPNLAKTLHVDFRLGHREDDPSAAVEFIVSFSTVITSINASHFRGQSVQDLDAMELAQLASSLIGISNLNSLELEDFPWTFLKETMRMEGRSVSTAPIPTKTKMLRLYSFRHNLDVDAAEALVAGMSLTSVEYLELSIREADADALLVLGNHFKQSTVRKLTIQELGGDNNGQQFLSNLIAHNRSTEYLRIGNPEDPVDAALGDHDILGIAEGLQQNTTLRHLDIHSGWNEHLNVSPLAVVLANPSPGFRLETLQLHYSCYNFPTKESHSALCDLISSPNCSLSSLALEAEMDQEAVKSLLSSLEDSSLRAFQLLLWADPEVIDDDQFAYYENFGHLRDLALALPKFSNSPERLSFGTQDCDWPHPSNAIKESLLRGMEQNTHLESIDLSIGDDMAWGESFTQKMQSYCTRNKIEKTATALSSGQVPLAAMPKIFNAVEGSEDMAASHNATFLYHGLRTRMEPDMIQTLSEGVHGKATDKGASHSDGFVTDDQARAKKRRVDAAASISHL